MITGRETHPFIPLPTERLRQFMGADWSKRMDALRAEAMGRMEVDPLRYGQELPIWTLADKCLAEFRKRFPTGVITELDLGGNRASKTERRAKRLVENLVTKPGWKAWACQATETASVQNQQSVIYKYLPREWKPETGKLRHGVTTKIVYSQSGGFTENVLVCPNKSECRFKFYEMKVRNLEGAELDEAWCDELVPPDWIEALIFRLVTRNGLMGITFTPIEGYTSTVKLHLNGAKTVQEETAELLPLRNGLGEVTGYEKVPRIQENLNVDINGQRAKALIVYFHTKDNPYGNYESMAATLEGASRSKILTRVYGVPTRAVGNKFPLFSDLTHVISLNRFREIQKGGGVWYHFLDPCSGRNWFQNWIFVDPLNRAFVAGESPSFDHDWAYIPGVGNPGPWAVAGSKADGEQGDGQKEWGWGYDRYKEEMERMERLLSGGDDSRKRQPVTNQESRAGINAVPFPSAQRISVMARWIDARYGNARRTQVERSTTLIQDLWDIGLEFLAAPTEQHLFDTSKGGASIRMINDKLFYDTDRPIDHTNQPHLYCVETVPNTIYALKEWTGEDKQHGACKDPLDNLRAFVLSGSSYVDETLLTPRTPWLAQFGR